MSGRPPAVRHDELIAAVAELSAEMRATRADIKRVEDSLTALNATVTGEGGHAEQIRNWRRDGKWVAGALVALGSFGSLILGKMIDTWPWH
jgi:hypothetical protein